MNAYYQLKPKQTCFMQEAFWINLAMIEFRLWKSQSIATDRSPSYLLIDYFD